MTREINGLDELTGLIGQHLGFSEWLTVDQARIDLFADATGDHQWIHIDPARAKDGPYGATIAHGYLTLSLVPLLANQVYEILGTTMGVNYGSNRVRFAAPVRVNSRVRAGVELLSVTTKPMGAQIESRVTIELDGSDKPACVADTLALLAF
jgi:acyl dehydratase